jgi:hypothetical protein
VIGVGINSNFVLVGVGCNKLPSKHTRLWLVICDFVKVWTRNNMFPKLLAVPQHCSGRSVARAYKGIYFTPNRFSLEEKTTSSNFLHFLTNDIKNVFIFRFDRRNHNPVSKIFLDRRCIGSSFIMHCTGHMDYFDDLICLPCQRKIIL